MMMFTFPKSTLAAENIYWWEDTDPSAPSLLRAPHMDVVPVDPTE